jgi:hypothetical protein
MTSRPVTPRNGTAVGQAKTVATFVPTDGSDVIVFDETTCQIHRMVSSAASIWAAIDGRRSTAEIIAVVAAQYGLDGEVIAGDVRCALDRFANLGLIAAAG